MYAHEAEWTQFQTHCYSEILVAPGIELATSATVARNSHHQTTEAVVTSGHYPSSCFFKQYDPEARVCLRLHTEPTEVSPAEGGNLCMLKTKTQSSLRNIAF
jgi:hypothetical protein